VLWLRSADGLHPALDQQRANLLNAVAEQNAERESVISLVGLKTASGEQRVSAVLVPVRANGRVVGTLGVGLDAAKLQERVASIRPLGVGVAALIAHDTILVAHPDPSRVGMLEADSEADFLGDHLSVITDAVRKGLGVTLRFESPAMAEEVFMLVTPVTIGETATPWSLGLAFPSSALLGGVKALALKLILLGSFAALMLGITVLLLGRALAQPLNAVVSGIRQLASGEADLSSRLPAVGNDELATLAREFNLFLGAMAELVFESRVTVARPARSSTPSAMKSASWPRPCRKWRPPSRRWLAMLGRRLRPPVPAIRRWRGARPRFPAW
jgi:methyl-accepting chemotaxis protein